MPRGTFWYRRYWRWLSALWLLLLGSAVVAVSLWRQVGASVDEQTIPILVEQQSDLQESLKAALEPGLYGLPEPGALPMSPRYITTTAREWLALARERGTIEAVERRRVLAEVRVSQALRLAGMNERASAMETAARAVVYLSRAAEDLQTHDFSTAVMLEWKMIHNTTESLRVALESFRNVMPVAWRATVDGWNRQVDAVHAQAEERLGFQSGGSLIDR